MEELKYIINLTANTMKNYIYITILYKRFSR